jgi:valyl-tRNA synthetase
MMMMGMHFMGDVPFRDVYIHALVRDADGKKMSKSKGNVIDPLYVIDKFGTDAFRFTLAALAAQGRDIRLSEERIEGYRHFVNKLWNASRFSLMHLEEYSTKGIDERLQDLSACGVADRWILSRLNSVVATVTQALDEYKFNEAAGALYQFVWHEFCDWYLEIIKPVLYGEQSPDADGERKKVSRSGRYDTTLAALWSVLNETLRLLHPFMPFVTEEIWDKMPATKGSIVKAPFPVVKTDRQDRHAEEIMNLVMGITTGIRNVRGEMGVPPSLQLTATVQSPDEGIRRLLSDYRDIVVGLAKLEALDVATPGQRPPSSATSVFGDCTIFVSLKGIIDFKTEQERLNKEIAKIDKELTGVEKKLSNEAFLSKAPQDVVYGVRSKRALFVEKKGKLEKHLAVVQELILDESIENRG